MSKHPLHRSFGFALRGLRLSLRERNMRIHLLAAVSVIILSAILQISGPEWMMVLLCISGVIGLELVNTALEKLTDLASPGKHPLAGAAKDIAAAAVLVAATASVAIACMIFLPYFFN